jgi:hypothetical protein
MPPFLLNSGGGGKKKIPILVAYRRGTFCIPIQGAIVVCKGSVDAFLINVHGFSSASSLLAPEICQREKVNTPVGNIHG